LHHLVRERYPRFNDALADLDDALTLTYLFAALPSTTSIKAKIVNKAKSMAAAWGAYCSTATCMTKSFISVKGVYLEASIRGVPIRWVVPHSFTQFMPEDVDYRVMTTFFEFYETLLHFVLYKLYTDLGVRYPLPAVEAGGEVKGSTTHILGANLRSLTNAMNSSKGEITNLVSESVKEKEAEKSTSKPKKDKKKEKELIKSVGAALNSINEDSDSDDNEEEDDVDVAGPLKAALESMADEESRASGGGKLELDNDSLTRRRLFSGLTFFLSREVPRGYLELVCLAFGGKVGWEGPNSPISANDPTITHHIVDRPALPSSYNALPKSREFVQPQWILDCTNFVFLLPIAKYSVGATLPPHLSPWVDDEEEGYKPAYAEEIARIKNGEPAILEDEETEEMDAETSNDAKEIESEAESTKSEDEDSEEEVVDKKKSAVAKKKATTKKAKAEKRRRDEEEEAHVLAKTMMSRKAAHLYGRMQHGISNKSEKVENLMTKRKAIEDENRSKRKDNLGRTPLKQKVDRLRDERKRIEDSYSNTGGSMKKSKKKKGV
jgi:pescadillo protein